MDKIERKLNEETERGRVIREQIRDQYRNRNDIATDYDTRCFPRLHPIFRAILSDEKQMNAYSAAISKVDDSSSDERVEKIRTYLKDGQFEEVARYIIQLDVLVGHQNEWKSLGVDEQILYFVTLLKTYLFNDYVSNVKHM